MPKFLKIIRLCTLSSKFFLVEFWNEGEGYEGTFKTYALPFCSLDGNWVRDAGAIAIAETLKVNTTLAFVKYVCVPVAHTCGFLIFRRVWWKRVWVRRVSGSVKMID